MRVYETEAVPPMPATTRQVCVGRTCDLCGKKADRGGEWCASSYDVAETEVTVTVECKVGTSYPEGGSRTEWDVDLCPTCFVVRLVPWLRSQGAAVTPREVDA